MGKYLLYNDNFLPSESPIIEVTNRAFCYGDGIFETIRCLNSRPLFFDKHFYRVQSACHDFKMSLHADFNKNYFENLIFRLLQRNRYYKGAKARLYVFRNTGGLYAPTSNSASYILSVEDIEDEKFELNKKGLIIEIFPALKKTPDMFAHYKTLSAQLFVLAGLWKNENNLDDCFILNTNNKIIEALSSNIFIVIENILITPSVESGCIDGTMRRTILELAQSNNIAIREIDGLTKEYLLKADEIFLTNATQGIKWVGAYKNRRYLHTLATKLISKLNSLLES